MLSIPSVTSMSLQRRPVELRVRLHRRDQRRDPPGRLLDLRRATTRSRACSPPSRGRARACAVEHLARRAHTRRARHRPARAWGRCATRRPPRARRASRAARLRDPRPRWDRCSRSTGSISRRSASIATNCSGGQRALGETYERREDVVVRLLQRVDGARRGRRRVVDLVGEAGGERSERDQRVALARHRFHHAHGLEEALDEVDAEREPGAGELTELGRRERAASARGPEARLVAR